jgi:hypothetical protein
MKKSKDTKQLLFETMAKVNPDFKLTEDLGNFHASFAERTGQIFKDANDAWTNGAFHIRYKMLTQLGIEDQLAQKYAEQYENTPWIEVKAALGKSVNEDDKWIQKAVDPEHKGYCTPMTKPTCTPRRKALAKRFKKGIDEDVPKLDSYDQDNPQFKDLAEKIKAVIDDLYVNGDYDILQTIYKLVVNRGHKFIPKSAAAMSEGIGGEDYKIVAERLKGKIDFLRDNGHADILDKVDDIISRLFPMDDEPETEIAEAPVPQQNDTYFETLSAALDAVRERVAKKGYSVDEDAVFQQFGTGGISYGQTKRATIPLINIKTGLPEKRRSVTVAIYRMDSGKYELTAYLN